MTKTKIGRPRSEKAQEAILNATHDLLDEKGGAGLTIEAIAKRAGVGKPTIYRWWPSLADIVLDVLLRQADADIPVPPFTTLRETLLQFLGRSMQSILDGSGVHLRFLMARAQTDDSFRERFRENFTLKRRAVLKALFLQAVEHGEIAAGQNLDMLIDLIFGTMWYRLLTDCAPMDEAFAHELTEVVMSLVRVNRA